MPTQLEGVKFATCDKSSVLSLQDLHFWNFIKLNSFTFSVPM